jgi:hypothetical protein
MPTEGIWLVTHKKYSKASSFIMKVSDLPKKWPLLHYYEYRDQILDELIKYIDDENKNKNGISLNEVVTFVLEFISKKYVEERNSDTKDRIVEKIEDLNDDY